MTATVPNTMTSSSAARRVPRQHPAVKPGADAQAVALLRRLAAVPADAPARVGLRGRAIEAWLPLARHLAQRFHGRGEPLDDLVQIATVGLIKAIDRFDPEYGNDFAAYAVPTIVGEIKRHFRDRTWDIRVPRRLQELKLDGFSHTIIISGAVGCKKPDPAIFQLALKHTGLAAEQAIFS